VSDLRLLGYRNTCVISVNNLLAQSSYVKVGPEPKSVVRELDCLTITPPHRSISLM